MVIRDQAQHTRQQRAARPRPLAPSAAERAAEVAPIEPAVGAVNEAELVDKQTEEEQQQQQGQQMRMAGEEGEHCLQEPNQIRNSTTSLLSAESNNTYLSSSPIVLVLPGAAHLPPAKVHPIAGQRTVEEERAEEDGQRPARTERLEEVRPPAARQAVLGDALRPLVGGLVARQQVEVVGEEAAAEERPDQRQHREEVAQRRPPVDVPQQVEGNGNEVGGGVAHAQPAHVAPDVGAVEGEGVHRAEGHLKEQAHVVPRGGRALGGEFASHTRQYRQSPAALGGSVAGITSPTVEVSVATRRYRFPYRLSITTRPTNRYGFTASTSKRKTTRTATVRKVKAVMSPRLKLNIAPGDEGDEVGGLQGSVLYRKG
ncbi:hypothetical protein TYRP_020437 [Tyrophagus putrescentiae]|nr:hypothetical protein TYRP_020437 [Tyrophagus putrescentiae]